MELSSQFERSNGGSSFEANPRIDPTMVAEKKVYSVVARTNSKLAEPRIRRPWITCSEINRLTSCDPLETMDFPLACLGFTLCQTAAMASGGPANLHFSRRLLLEALPHRLANSTSPFPPVFVSDHSLRIQIPSESESYFLFLI